MRALKKEYPEGQRITEMVLVKMLKEKRCWADYLEITQALYNIRFHAESMKKEQSMVNADTNCGAVADAPDAPESIRSSQ